MLSEAHPWVRAREVRAREMTWTTADRTRRGQPRGSGRGKDIAAMEGLPHKDGTEEMGDHILIIG